MTEVGDHSAQNRADAACPSMKNLKSVIVPSSGWKSE